MVSVPSKTVRCKSIWHKIFVLLRVSQFFKNVRFYNHFMIKSCALIIMIILKVCIEITAVSVVYRSLGLRVLNGFDPLCQSQSLFTSGNTYLFCKISCTSAKKLQSIDEKVNATNIQIVIIIFMRSRSFSRSRSYLAGVFLAGAENYRELD